MTEFERVDFLTRHGLADGPIPVSYIRLNKRQNVFFWVAMAVFGLSYAVFYFDDSKLVIWLMGFGVLLTAFACQAIMDLWYWKLTAHLTKSLYENVRRLHWTLFYVGGTCLALGLLINKTNPPVWLAYPALILIVPAIVLHLIVLLWSHYQ
jgi:hypothetical protein